MSGDVDRPVLAERVARVTRHLERVHRIAQEGPRDLVAFLAALTRA